MTLSRSMFTSPYGDFRKMMESREEHGGYGNVTWKVGPHAGDQPYGGNHGVVFVNRNALLQRAHPPAQSHEVERHANEMGQQMERGDVINVPHVQVKGSKFHLDPEHHGALQAAAGRGADMVPVVVNNQDRWAMGGLEGGFEKPGAHGGRDPNFKWRWNGKGWYTKPSFNEGRCPEGQSASDDDQCVGGGPAPGSMAPPKQAPGAEQFPGDAQNSSLMPPASPADHMRAMRNRANRAGGGQQRPGQVLDLPPAQPMSGEDPGPIDHDIVRGHSSIRKGGGLDLGYDAPPMGQVMGSLANLLPDLRPGPPTGRGAYLGNRMRRELNDNGQGEWADSYISSGASGAVFTASPHPQTGIPMVVKVDKGENEASLALASQHYPDIAALPSIPNYEHVVDTGVTDERGQTVYALYREDLDDPSYERNDFFREFGMRLVHKMSQGLAKYGGAGYDDKWPKPRTLTRQQMLAQFHKAIDDEGWRARAHQGGHLESFDQVVKDISHMIKRGFIPCDLHGSNWGVRRSTGEMVMRDMGCVNFSKDVQ